MMVHGWLHSADYQSGAAMKTLYFVGLVAAATLGCGSVAQATVILTAGNQPGLTNIHGAGGLQTGNTVFGTVGVGGPSVSFKSTDTITTNGGGQAFIDGVGRNGVFDNVAVFMTTYAYGFTELNFNMQKLAQAAGFNATIDVYDLSNALIASFVMPVGNGQNKGYLHGDAGEVFSKVVFNSGANGQFSSVRQFDMTLAPANAVPEPATWALMISGFGLVGSALRRRRTALSA